MAQTYPELHWPWSTPPPSPLHRQYTAAIFPGRQDFLLCSVPFTLSHLLQPTSSPFSFPQPSSLPMDGTGGHCRDLTCTFCLSCSPDSDSFSVYRRSTHVKYSPLVPSPFPSPAYSSSSYQACWYLIFSFSSWLLVNPWLINTTLGYVLPLSPEQCLGLCMNNACNGGINWYCMARKPKQLISRLTICWAVGRKRMPTGG